MPEGDSLVRLAARLQPSVGANLRELRSNLAALVGFSCDGLSIVGIAAHGKNLHISLSDGRTIRSHLMMRGRWWWRAKPSWVRSIPFVQIVTDRGVLEGRNIRRIEVVQAQDLPLRAAAVGRDLSHADVDISAAAEALRRGAGHRPLGEAVMLQRLVAGVGNVFKNEILFMQRHHPLTLVEAVDVESLQELLQAFSKSLQINATRRRRFFRSEQERFWVYRRRYFPCFDCGTPIMMIRQGSTHRSSYFCPSCQKP